MGDPDFRAVSGVEDASTATAGMAVRADEDDGVLTSATGEAQARKMERELPPREGRGTARRAIG